MCAACEVKWEKEMQSHFDFDTFIHTCDIAGVPRKMLRINDIPLAKKANAICDHAFKERKGLLLTGPSGSGKTLTLAILARRSIGSGGHVTMENIPQLADRARKVIGEGAGSMAGMIEALKRSRHLILDDLGAESDSSGWWRSVLHGILDYRYTRGLITSAGIAVPEQVGGAIMRRLQENTLAFDLKGE
jgi:DNA replication protein DnaC